MLELCRLPLSTFAGCPAIHYFQEFALLGELCESALLPKNTEYARDPDLLLLDPSACHETTALMSNLFSNLLMWFAGREPPDCCYLNEHLVNVEHLLELEKAKQ